MFRSLRAALVGLVLAPALVFSALPASATPPPPRPPATVTPQAVGPGDPGVISPPKHDPSGAKNYTWNVSKAQWDAANRAYKASSPAHVNSSDQFDYRWVKDKFSGHPTQLSQFAIGLWYRRQDWGQFTHISAADKRKIIAYGRDHSGPNPRRASAFTNPALTTFVRAGDDGVLSKAEKSKVQRKAPNPCLGRTVTANNKEDKLFWVYYKSCDTANIIDLMDGSVYVLGVVSAIVGVVTAGAAALVPACVAGMMWLAKKYMENRRDASSLKAVIIRFSYNVKKSKYGRYYAPMRIFPQ